MSKALPLTLGAIPTMRGCRFRLAAPGARGVEVLLHPGSSFAMEPVGNGYFEIEVPGVPPGTHYRYTVDGAHYPDPASRFQPLGPHGASMVVDAGAYPWTDATWRGPRLEHLVFYELHVGTFTPQGTFEGVRRRLPYLRDLGVSALELMPVAEFPGRWNWGYDVAAPFAPAHVYGTPDELRGLVNDAHRLGLAVFLDVVYNHFGPDGAYATAVNPQVFSRRHRTPWGPAINYDGDGCELVRHFVVENALHWFLEYHIDGLRLDATHAIVDHSLRHILADLADAVRPLPPKRYLVAEDHRNLNRLVLPPFAGGYGLDAVWSDDYHHQLRRILTGQDDGYFADFTDSADELATIIRQGWLFTGQRSRYFGGSRGTDPEGIPLSRFVHFLQNHDQVGNRPAGDRLSSAVTPSTYRAVAALLLFSPSLPLLFMGQEWGASTPFLYFTDHRGDLGLRVSQGRQEEFRAFRGFAAVPDPQDPATFLRSRLDWTEPARGSHAGMLQLHRDLLAIRGRLRGEVRVVSPVEGGLLLRRDRHVLLVALQPGVTLPLAEEASIVWHSEQVPYTAVPEPPVRRADGSVHFPTAASLVAELP